MRKVINSIVAVIALAGMFALMHPTVTYAADPFKDVCTGGTGDSTVCKTKTTDNPLVGSNGILTRVTDILATVGGVMVVIMIIVAGIKYATSNGDSSRAASAKSTIIYGLVGLVVIIVARTIIGFVITKV